MDELNYTPDQNWDRDTYRTGKTRPPKRRSGLIAILLIVVIFLSGIASAMGLLNIRLFRKIAGQTPPENTTPLSFSHLEDQSSSKEQDLSFVPEDEATEDTPAVDLQPSPEAVENIPQAGGLSLQEIYVNTIDSVVSIGCVLPNGILPASRSDCACGGSDLHGSLHGGCDPYSRCAGGRRGYGDRCGNAL